MEDLSDIFSVDFGITVHLETVLIIIFSARANLIGSYLQQRKQERDSVR